MTDIYYSKENMMSDDKDVIEYKLLLSSSESTFLQLKPDGR